MLFVSRPSKRRTLPDLLRSAANDQDNGEYKVLNEASSRPVRSLVVIMLLVVGLPTIVVLATWFLVWERLQ